MADIVLILIITLFAFLGYKRGFAKTLISALSNIISIVFSMIFTGPVTNLIFKSPIGEMIKNSAESAIKGNLGNSELVEKGVSVMADGVAMVFCSIISFVLIAIVVKIAVMLIAQAVGIVTKLPFLKQANAALGVIIGVISGVVISYVLIGIIYALGDGGAMESGMLIESIENSIICSGMYYNNLVGNALAVIV